MLGQQQHALRLVLIAGRDEPGATEAFVYLLNRTEPVLLLDLHSRRAGGRVGYLELELAAVEPGPGQATVGLYELTRLVEAHSPVRHPVVSLSGVLWTRQEVLAQLAAGDASLPLEGLNLQFGPRSTA